MSAIFITATGTDIGKTFVAAGLIRHYRDKRPIDALKPVATGFDPTVAMASDPGVLLAALGRQVTAPEIDRISPWRFAAPLSPDMAAKNEGRSIVFDELLSFCRNAMGASPGMLLIEGIGGVMVPLGPQRTVLDWIAALGIPALLVTGSYLGSLSHTLTAVDAVRRRSVPITALVVNETPASTVPLADTIATLSGFVRPVPVIALRRDPETQARTFAEIAALL